ncbi:MAG: hypothetical protein A4E38_00244 [Methanoregulaceae archaeon PtaB.Bin108]|nr:MAG: hypothetical protein A4E38_00244 [Methanoregulaceae archaeon PtaB.Bin108]
MPAGGSGSTDEPLEFEARDHVLVFVVSPFVLLFDREYIIPSCNDCSTYLDLDKFVLHLKVDCLLVATGIHAQPALDTAVKVHGIDERHHLGVVDIDCLPGLHPHLEGVRLDDRAYHITVPAAVAAAAHDAFSLSLCRGENSSCLLPDGHIKVADIPLDSLDFGIRHQLDVRGSPHIHHLRSEDTLRTIECGEGLVELGHAPADGRVLLNEVCLDPCIGQVESSLHSCNPCTDDHRGLLHRHRLRNQVFEERGFCHCNADCVLCLRSATLAVVHVHPGTLLADVCHLEAEWV